MNVSEMWKNTILVIILTICFFDNVEGVIRRCFTCRSRGELGSCKDPFKLNSTDVETSRSVKAVPCASGWCGKMLEGGDSFKDDDYGIATQRMCLQRGPTDKEERCANTVWNNKRVYMCFCLGDLCNGSLSNRQISILSIFIPLFVLFT